jgi:hypothetical protein
MKKLLGIVAVLGIVSFAIFRFLYFNDVRVLEEFDFSEGEWKLQKGYYRDSIQYIITDNIELQSLKDVWVLSSADRNFATTGGYEVSLYSDGKVVLMMDLILDCKADLHETGILAYDKGTLAYRNLNWLEEGGWRRVIVSN